jgi:hypothetical protein
MSHDNHWYDPVREKSFKMSESAYSAKHDAWYDPDRNIWLEKKCEDPDCELCRDRPDTPREKEDYFDEVEYIENCMICRNRNTDKCVLCRHN